MKIVLNIFGYTSLVNQIIGLFGGDAVNFFGEAKLFQPLVIGTDIWKGFGYNTVVYLAAILGVGRIVVRSCGSTRLRTIQKNLVRNFTGIKTTVALLAILSLGNVLNAGFDQIYNRITRWFTQQVILLTHGYTEPVCRISSIHWNSCWIVQICDQPCVDYGWLLAGR